MPNAADFEKEIRRRWAHAIDQDMEWIDIQAGDVHRTLGGYPSRSSRMPNCCQVMKRLMGPRDSIRHAPEKGQGASLLIRYALPR
jgi:5-methylcytosine-specific restriction protein A